MSNSSQAIVAMYPAGLFVFLQALRLDVIPHTHHNTSSVIFFRIQQVGQWLIQAKTFWILISSEVDRDVDVFIAFALEC